MYSDKALVIDLDACKIYDRDNYPSEYWGIYKAKINDEDVYYIYNKYTLCIVYYIIADKSMADIKNVPSIHKHPAIILDDISYKDNKYSFSLYARDYDGYALIHIDYNTEADICTVEYKGTELFYPHGIQTFKNNVPKLDAQGKLKLTLGNTCAFTLLENRVLREVD